MERYEIEVFLTLAQELHFGRTAERLRLSTARVTQTVQKLERRIGGRLFDRTSRRVSLTELGRRFHDDLAPAYQQVRAALARATAMAGTVRVGFVGAAAGRLAVRAADALGDVEVRELQYNDAVERLRRKDVDVLLGCLPMAAPDLVVGPVLLAEPWMLALPAGHALARRESVRVTDLTDLPVVDAPCSLPRGWYRAAGRAETLQEALILVGTGKGDFPVAAHVAHFHRRPDVAYVSITDAPPLHWAAVRRREPAPAVDAVITHLAERAADAPTAGRSKAR